MGFPMQLRGARALAYTSRFESANATDGATPSTNLAGKAKTNVNDSS